MFLNRKEEEEYVAFHVEDLFFVIINRKMFHAT